MFQNYIKVIIRNIVRHSGYAVLNLMGLAIGMTCCILIMLYIQDEFSFDRQPENYERIHRLTTTVSMPDRGDLETAKSPIAWGWMLRDEFPEVENFTRIKAPMVSWPMSRPRGDTTK